jgi:GT2 family glycosyltransferase
LECHVPVARFSIFIPIWNDAAWLRGAIDSVLAQTHPDWELVIGDNASDDDLEAIVAGYADPRIRYHRWPTHIDYAGNTNRTVRLCRFEWLQYLSADDRLAPTCLERMAALVAEAEVAGRPLAVVLTGCRRLDAAGQRAEHVYFGTWRLASIPDGIYEPAEWLRLSAAAAPLPWNMGSIAIAAGVYEVMGGFYREEIGLTADVEVVTRAAAYGPVGYVADPLLDYTVRSESMTLGLARRNLAQGQDLPPVGAALVSALAVHEHRRVVTPEERGYVLRQVADQLLGRALQQRYLAGGRGRAGAMRDVSRALLFSRAWLLSPRQLLRVTAAVVAPRWLIEGLKRRFMLRGRFF